jgi:predicted metal-dependent HD superfamily phosphohydrolase
MNFPIIPDYSLGRFWKNYDFLSEKWASLMYKLGAEDGTKLFHEIFEKYSEDHRNYHTPEHIEHMLKEFDKVKDLSEKPSSLELAIFLHDVIYDFCGNNEIRSSRYAFDRLTDIGVPIKIAAEVSEIILATQYPSNPNSLDEQLISDLDLSSLALSEKEFEENAENIRKEYNYVPENEFNKERKKLLQGFLNQPFIYHTPYFRDKYESQAKKNLEHTIQKLK